jgi:hypothetical protein
LVGEINVAANCLLQVDTALSYNCKDMTATICILKNSYQHIAAFSG